MRRRVVACTLSGGMVLEALPAKLGSRTWLASASSLAALRPPVVKAFLRTCVASVPVTPMFANEEMARMRRLLREPLVDKATTRSVRRIDLRSDPTDTHKKVRR